MKLEIISPEKTYFRGEVEWITLPGAMGPFQILKNHAPIISSLTRGQIVFSSDGHVKDMEINDYLTVTQQEREKRRTEVCNAYRSITKDHKMLRPYGVMRVIAIKYNLTVPGVAKIIQAAGLYTPRHGRNNKETQPAAARSEGAADAH